MMTNMRDNSVFFELGGAIIEDIFRSQEEEEEWEPVEKDHVVKFFQVINGQMHVQIVGFNQQIAQYRGKVPEKQLTGLAVSHFEDQLAKTQQQVLASMGISLEDMEDSSTYYEAEGDSQVKGLMEALKMMYLSVSNEPAEEKAPDLPDDLSAEKMVTVVTIFFAAANKVVRETVEELLAEGKSLSDPSTAMEMTMLLQQRTTPATDEAIKRFKLDSTTINTAIQKYQEVPEVRNAINAGSEGQREILAAYGIA